MFQDIPRRNYIPYQQNRQPKLPAPTPRLAIEHPSTSNRQTAAMCDFHLTTDHDGASCPEMTRFMQMNQTSEKIEEYVEDETNQQFGPPTVNFLEYESGEENEKDSDINNHSCNVFTKNWRQKLGEKAKLATKDKEVDEVPKQILSRKPSKEEGSSRKAEKEVEHGDSSFEDSFDFIEYCKKTKVQISQFEYLKKNPQQLDKLVHCIKKDFKQPHSDVHQESSENFDDDEQEGFVSKESSLVATSFSNKPDPFYISLYIAGCKLSNYIIDSGSSDNVMPSKVAHALGLSLNKPTGKVFSMESKQVPLVGQIKDAQVVLAAHPQKKLKLNILVADIPASYGMLLSHSFCKDLGGEIQLDWSHALIPLGNKKVRLDPEPKAKYMVLKSDDPRAEILYVETGPGTYMMSSKKESVPEILAPDISAELWIMQFDGSSSSSGSGAGVVLISPQGEKFPKAYKLTFDTTNNTVEYEALLLGLEFAKEKEIKKLQVMGDAELVVNQVRSRYQTKNKRLKSYRNKVWDEIESFDAFSIQAFPREQNTKADSLAVSASLLLPHPEFEKDVYIVEMIYQPSVPDNNQNWQVFDDDKHIISFLEGTGTFSNSSFDGNHSLTSQQNIKEEDKESEILQLKGNTIPKGLVTLESLFDKNDQFVKNDEKKPSSSPDTEKVNIGFENDPKIVLIGKCLSHKERKVIIDLLNSYIDVFAWCYDDLKVFMNGEFKHHIPLKPNSSPFKQKQRQFNPKIADAIFAEVDKMLKAKIIYPIHHSTWVANIVPVRKKNGEIRICVDFRNLNQASLKDNYPLPVMDHLLQTVSGLEMMSMLDGFFGYNQIGVKQDDQHKTAFTTPWGTFAYNRMPFGLINASATFQRAMDLSFGDLRNKIIVVYLDDLTVFSKKREEHAYHLECVLQRCRQQGISLNPKKSIFGVTEGKLLGHIVSKEGIHIDPEQVKAIQQLPLPSSKPGVRSFFGQINFIRKFIPDFSEITKSIVDMMRDNVTFKWSEEGKRAFNQIKSAIADAPTLVYPDFSKDFNVYCYASDITLSAILTQHHNENIEAPISFMSIPLKKHELKYSPVEKQAYAVVKAMKQFRFYVLNSHSIVYVPDTAVKTLLTQQEIGMSKRASWIAKVQEYDIDIKPTKLVRGCGLCKLIAENNSNGNVAQESELPLVLFVSTTDEWFSNIAHFLTYGECPAHLTPREKRTIKLKAAKYIIWGDVLYKKGVDGTFLRCVDKEQRKKLLQFFHNEACGGHFSSSVTAFKILRNCYY